MLRIINKKIENKKKISYALLKVYGINVFQTKKICKNTGLNPKTQTLHLKNYHINRLKNFIKENIIIEHFLKEKKKKKIQLLLEIKNKRGIRQHFGLPVRGQRTHSNAKTSKKFVKKK
jgi:small subunit ribosomal protein S13